MIKQRIVHYWNNANLRTRNSNRNIAYSLMVKGASIIVSLLIIPLTLGYLSPYEYGVWLTLNSVLTWVNYFDIGLGHGLRNRLVEALANKDFKLGQIYVSTTFFLMFLIALVLVLFFLLINSWIDWNCLLNVTDSVPNLPLVVTIVFVSLCVSFIFKTVGTIYLAYQEPAINNLLFFLGSLVSYIWIFVLTKTTEVSLVKVALAFSLSPVLVFAFAYPFTFYVHKSIAPSVKAIKMKYARNLTGLGLQFFFLQISCLVIFSTSNILISRLFNPSEVTPYNMAFKYFNVIAMLFAIVISPLWSAITDAYVKKETAWIIMNIRKMMIFWGLCSFGLLLMIPISKFVFRLWIGDEVQISYSLSISMATYTSVYLWTQIFASYSNGVGNLKGQIFSMSIAAVLFVPIAIFLSQYLGIEGIAYAMAIVLLVPGVLLFIEYRKSILKLSSTEK